MFGFDCDWCACNNLEITILGEHFVCDVCASRPEIPDSPMDMVPERDFSAPVEPKEELSC